MLAVLEVVEVVALPADREVLASLHSADIPPERWMRTATAIKATKAVSRQYSATSCPRSSDCKAFKKRREIAITKPKIRIVRGQEYDHNLFRYGPKAGDRAAI